MITFDYINRATIVYTLALCMALYTDFGKGKSFLSYLPDLIGYFIKFIIWGIFCILILAIFKVWVVVVIPISLFIYLMIIKVSNPTRSSIKN